MFTHGWRMKIKLTKISRLKLSQLFLYWNHPAYDRTSVGSSIGQSAQQTVWYTWSHTHNVYITPAVMQRHGFSSRTFCLIWLDWSSPTEYDALPEWDEQKPGPKPKSGGGLGCRPQDDTMEDNCLRVPVLVLSLTQQSVFLVKKVPEPKLHQRAYWKMLSCR